MRSLWSSYVIKSPMPIYRSCTVVCDSCLGSTPNAYLVPNSETGESDLMAPIGWVIRLDEAYCPTCPPPVKEGMLSSETTNRALSSVSYTHLTLPTNREV